MSVQRTYQQSDLEKRLKLLNMQLYGKKEKLSLDSARDRDVRSGKIDKEVRSLKLDNPTSNFQSHSPASNLQHQTSRSDVTYLRQDLLKILILSTLAFAALFSIYFGNMTSRFKFF